MDRASLPDIDHAVTAVFAIFLPAAGRSCKVHYWISGSVRTRHVKGPGFLICRHPMLKFTVMASCIQFLQNTANKLASFHTIDRSWCVTVRQAEAHRHKTIVACEYVIMWAWTHLTKGNWYYSLDDRLNWSWKVCSKLSSIKILRELLRARLII